MHRRIDKESPPHAQSVTEAENRENWWQMEDV